MGWKETGGGGGGGVQVGEGGGGVQVGGRGGDYNTSAKSEQNNGNNSTQSHFRIRASFLFKNGVFPILPEK